MDRFSSNDKVYCADQMGGWTQDYDGSMGFDFSSALDSVVNKAQESLISSAEKSAEKLSAKAISEVEDFLGLNKGSTIQPTQTLASGTQVYTKTTTGEPIIQTVQKVVDDGDKMLKYVSYGLYGLAAVLGIVLVVRLAVPRTPARATA